MPELVVYLGMANTQPFVALACFCENVLEDKDGVLSAIRVVDTYTLPPLPEGAELPNGLRGVILLNGLITLKSGDVVGNGVISVVMHKTNGEQSVVGKWPMALKGEEYGATLRLQMPLGVKNFGLIWFDVLWNDALLTRIPLKLQPASQPEATAPSEPS